MKIQFPTNSDDGVRGRTQRPRAGGSSRRDLQPGQPLDFAIAVPLAFRRPDSMARPYRLIALLGLLALGTLLSAATTGSSKRPNILFILTDDQGYGDLSLHGNPHLRTPTMDALGRAGVRLDRFYVSPVCAPTRASVLTGRHALRTGASGVTRRQEVMNPDQVTLAELLRAAGYATGCFGKWHNGALHPETPQGRGFEEFFGFYGGVTQHYFDPMLVHEGVERKHPGYITELLTDAALAWLERQVEAERPFFCYLPYNAPHTPGLVPERYWQRFRDSGLNLPEAVIYGMIEALDEQLARLLAFLERPGLAENTIVVFLTDNGPNTARFNAGLRGKKADLFDGGIRVPCFIRWPGRLAPRIIERPLAHIDLLPTLLEWCRVPLPASLAIDGRSFATLAERPDAAWPERTLVSFGFGTADTLRSNAAVHTDRWTAVQQAGRWQLFDAEADRGQSRDLAGHFPDVIAALRSEFERLLAEMPRLAEPAPLPVDPAAWPSVMLAAPDAALVGAKGREIDYNFPAGFNGHWVSRWRSTAAYPEWTLDVRSAGEYEVTLLYALAPAHRGVRGMFEFADERVPFHVTEPFVAEPYPQPFLLAGEAEKYRIQPWRRLPIGRVRVAPGAATARVRLTEIPGAEAIELKEVELRRVGPSP